MTEAQVEALMTDIDEIIDDHIAKLKTKVVRRLEDIEVEEPTKEE